MRRRLVNRTAGSVRARTNRRIEATERPRTSAASAILTKRRLEVERCGDGYAVTRVVVGGKLSDRKGVNIPDAIIPLSPLTAIHPVATSAVVSPS